ncbi:MAG: GatB/YqeY domain-containing protein [Candidatus Hydrogenedentes bacterium]|nr:GatB/YqeY domain-containing protein [Candidatus Hydrogenedentota bacterium]
MSIKADVQNALKEAMKNKDHARLEVLRMAKGALLLKEKEGAKENEITDDEAMAAIRSEIKKRQQTIEALVGKGRDADIAIAEQEIAVLEEFLPRQLSEAEVEAKVRAFLAEHPDMNHAGKLTGAMKKELGETVDGKLLNEVCRKVVG